MGDPRDAEADAEADVEAHSADPADAPPEAPSPACVDPDGDGHGEGEGCAGFDCDEAARTFTSGRARRAMGGTTTAISGSMR
jgi:hypothetical protein